MYYKAVFIDKVLNPLDYVLASIAIFMIQCTLSVLYTLSEYLIFLHLCGKST